MFSTKCYPADVNFNAGREKTTPPNTVSIPDAAQPISADALSISADIVPIPVTTQVIPADTVSASDVAQAIPPNTVSIPDAAQPIPAGTLFDSGGAKDISAFTWSISDSAQRTSVSVGLISQGYKLIGGDAIVFGKAVIFHRVQILL